MFSILEKYTNQDCIEFKKGQNLGAICIAPRNQSGVYLVYSEKKILKKLIYIGYSGKINQKGDIQHRKGGIRQRIVHGHQFGGKRNKTWSDRMTIDKIDSLKICWYITFENKIKDMPAYVEAILLQEYFEKFKTLPRWNLLY